MYDFRRVTGDVGVMRERRKRSGHTLSGGLVAGSCVYSAIGWDSGEVWAGVGLADGEGSAAADD